MGTILVGVAGWSYPDWEGPVYPRAKGRGFHPLAFLAPFIDVMEVNSSFYAVPVRAHVERWAKIAEEHVHLAFTAKLHRDLTHASWSPTRLEVLKGSLGAFEPLTGAGRLRAWLAQFPIGFVDAPGSRRHLGGLAGALEGTPWVLEVRHRSWFTPAGVTFLSSLPCSVAHLDLPFSPDHLPEEAPQLGPLGYLRLHGRNARAWFDAQAGRDDRYDHRYTPAEIDGLAERAQRIANAVDTTLVVANNHYGGKAVAAALEIKARVSGAAVPAPTTVLEAFPDLRPWTRPIGQASLFT